MVSRQNRGDWIYGAVQGATAYLNTSSALNRGINSRSEGFHAKSRFSINQVEPQRDKEYRNNIFCWSGFWHFGYACSHCRPCAYSSYIDYVMHFCPPTVRHKFEYMLSIFACL